MGKTGNGDSPFSRLYHVGVVVRDMEKAVNYYRSLGIEPFEPVWGGGVTAAEARFRGQPYSGKNILKSAPFGGIEIELCQPVAGESPGKEFLESKGEGINHLGFLVDDLDKELDKLVKKGFEVIFRIKYKQGGGCAYLNTGKVGGVLFELIQPPPGAKIQI